MTEHFKAPEKIQLSDEEIANLSDAQFKALVLGCSQNWLNLVTNYMEKMKGMLSEIKENVQIKGPGKMHSSDAQFKTLVIKMLTELVEFVQNQMEK